MKEDDVPRDDVWNACEANSNITRRALIASAAFIPVTAIKGAPQAGPSAVRTTAGSGPAAASVFSADQRRTLSAFVDRLVPNDELGPGATECGVVEYIDGCLAGFNAGEKPGFLESLTAVDAFAKSSQGAAFADLSPEKQEAVLEAIDGNRAPGLKAFFNRVRRLTLEGMFCDPVYGGNKNFAGWDLIRYPGAKMASTPEDQKMSAPPAPYRKRLYTKAGEPNAGGSHAH